MRIGCRPCGRAIRDRARDHHIGEQQRYIQSAASTDTANPGKAFRNHLRRLQTASAAR